MNQEGAFRAVLGAGFLAVILLTLSYRLPSWASKETLDRRQEGAFILATLRPIGLLLWLGPTVPTAGSGTRSMTRWHY